MRGKQLRGWSIRLMAMLLAMPTMAQILDDSTKQVYGPKTTKYFYEIDWRDNTQRLRVLDTTLRGFHNYNAPQMAQYHYADLGSFVTAVRPMFYVAPTQIGTVLGLSPYLPYTFHSDNIRYFDTKSPVIEPRYVQGTNGDQMIDLLYARNVNAQWNIGAQYKRLNNYKPFGGTNTRETMSDMIAVNVFTAYTAKSNRYRLLWHYAHLNAPTAELGGVRFTPGGDESLLYDVRLAAAQLGSDARSWQTQNNLHLYHELALAKQALTLFQTLDYQRQRDTYTQANLAQYRRFYLPSPEQIILGRDTTPDTLFYFNQNRSIEGSIAKRYEQSTGIKGTLAKFNYQIYFKTRIYDWNTSLSSDTLRVFAPDSTLLVQELPARRMLNGIENFVGGKLFYQFSEDTRLTAEAELQIGDNYRLAADFESGILYARFQSSLVSPTLFQRRYVSNAFVWNNDFSNVLTNDLSGGVHLRTKSVQFSPFVRYLLVNNFIYFDQTARPRQASQALSQTQLGANLEVRWRRLGIESAFTYTENLGADVWRVPRWWAWGRVYCQDCFLKKRLHSQLGFELNYRSGYFADAYMPATKQYYLQDVLEVRGYPVIDLFFNFQIKTFRMFAKLVHANQAPNSGYLITPFYPGLRRTFVFGVVWQFFD